MSNSEQFDFNAAERNRESVLAWLILHSGDEFIEKVVQVPGYSSRSMSVKIEVNGYVLPIASFEELVGRLAKAYADHRFKEQGLDTVQSAGLAAAQKLVREAHNGAYEKMGDLSTALDTVFDNIDSITRMMWDHQEHSTLGHHGLPQLLLPHVIERWSDKDPHRLRRFAIEFVCDTVEHLYAPDRFGKVQQIPTDLIDKWGKVLESLMAKLEPHELDLLYGRLDKYGILVERKTNPFG